MTVYVDDAVHPFGRMLMCHCWSDSESELFSMMDKIGVARKWIQGHPTISIGKAKNASWLHADISKGKRDLAIQHGAKVVDRYECLCHVARLDIASGDPYLTQRAWNKLDMIARCRGTAPVSRFQFRFSASYRR